MRQAGFGTKEACVRWTEAAGEEPARVYVHGLGSASTVYHAHIAAHAALSGRRSLFVDLPGHGISDRPLDFGYSLEEHADVLAAVLDAAGAGGAELVGHSMGGAVAIVLAARRPELVSRLVLAEANLDPNPPVTAGSSGIAAYQEDAFVHGGGFAETLERVGPVWRATMRLADPTALHRTAKGLIRGTQPTMRVMLQNLAVPRTYLQGEHSGELAGRAELEAAGVEVRTVPGAGHNIMFDNPEAFVAAVAAA
ncbi:pimeloyl-ACP methyl ester carboxylesterase [Streptomyces olivoverticillatus]|uniref:Pimeloyl-ACP methyl ester carboxylesterase n=1 Tax=Streptomyces olivoverticillatus TaxID=66427 RepID=A0A7W7LP40_9ACTN|nr:alpha/beta hydrolase [Streptomyces olivoverticillatus]MBB4893263.1 pimeloyl-ACP methyl ester carboxylesterase [Streptomyces olivoverticillatus]